MDIEQAPLSIGFSPCPNDTFIFYALVHGKINSEGLVFDSPLLEDVETLNSWAFEKKLDITKLSFHALGHVLDDYVLLHAGSALGRGCGPLLVAGSSFSLAELAEKRIAIPGRFTTAAMLLQMFEPGCGDLVTMRFDEIMPAIAAGEVDAGVIIHESRFTYHQYGLVLLQDLGTWWEDTTGCPIPLGCIAAKRTLPPETIRKVDRAIAASIRWAFRQREQCMPYIRQHAQELDDKVTREHIALYVNAFSEDLGGEGLRAIEEFFRLGRLAGKLPEGREPLTLP